LDGGILGRLKLFEDLSEQLRLHVEERVGQLIDQGLSPQVAEYPARIAFGNLALVEERSREVWRWPTLRSIWADRRMGVRSLHRTRGFAIAAVMTLALAIGVNVQRWNPGSIRISRWDDGIGPKLKLSPDLKPTHPTNRRDDRPRIASLLLRTNLFQLLVCRSFSVRQA
jgi:hypothetical protein